LATLADLEEKKRELEAQLAAGDPDAEAALDRLDRAIAARTQQIQYSRKRLSVARDAVDAGMDPDEARKKTTGRVKRKKPGGGPVNRF
jgi:hypothetical protein